MIRPIAALLGGIALLAGGYEVGLALRGPAQPPGQEIPPAPEAARSEPTPPPGVRSRPIGPAPALSPGTEIPVPDRSPLQALRERYPFEAGLTERALAGEARRLLRARVACLGREEILPTVLDVRFFVAATRRALHLQNFELHVFEGAPLPDTVLSCLRAGWPPTSVVELSPELAAEDHTFVDGVQFEHHVPVPIGHKPRQAP